MTRNNRVSIPRVSPEEAALLAVSSELKIRSMDLPNDFASTALDGLNSAIARRRDLGFETRINHQEIDGLVDAVLGSSGHTGLARDEFAHHAVWLLQTNDEAIAIARQQVSN